MAEVQSHTARSSKVSKIIEELIKVWLSDDKPETLNLFITGKTGVGKSRLVNALVGNDVAKEGRGKDPCTTQVTCYEVNKEDVKVTVWDSPGLQDGTNKESEYIQDMKEKIKDIALMIYCVKMDDTRFYEADKKAIKILTHEFGPDIWKHAVVALTFANRVEDPDGGDESEYFKMQLQNWIKQFKDYFAAVGVNPEVCCIPVIPVGNAKKSMGLPDRDNWLSHAWIECYQVMKASARQGMYRINKNRLKFDDSTTAPNTKATQCNANKISELEIPINDQQKESFWMSTWEAIKTATSDIASFTGKAFLSMIKNNVNIHYQNSEGVVFRLNSQPRSAQTPIREIWINQPFGVPKPSIFGPPSLKPVCFGSSNSSSACLGSGDSGSDGEDSSDEDSSDFLLPALGSGGSGSSDLRLGNLSSDVPGLSSLRSGNLGSDGPGLSGLPLGNLGSDGPGLSGLRSGNLGSSGFFSGDSSFSGFGSSGFGSSVSGLGSSGSGFFGSGGLGSGSSGSGFFGSGGLGSGGRD